jgi:subtilisin-like proprotein convertase family protein
MKRTNSKISRVIRPLSGGIIVFITFALVGISYQRGFEKVAYSDVTPQSRVAPRVDTTFNCTNCPITITELANATPYPATVTVTNQGRILNTNTAVTVTLTGINNQRSDDLDILLVAPTGETILILSDAGGTNTLNNFTLIFRDNGATQVPDSTIPVSGTVYKPTNQLGGNPEPEAFTAPAPAGPYGNPGPSGGGTLTFQALFAGDFPNGVWSLYIKDDAASGGMTGTITSWSLTLSTEASGPTDARMETFEATTREDGRVSLNWQTGYEVDNLGFNIYRTEGNKRVRVNKQIIAGSALLAREGTTLTAGRSYSWRDKLGKDQSYAQYWIEELDLKGRSIWHGPIETNASPGISRPADFGAQSLTVS